MFSGGGAGLIAGCAWWAVEYFFTETWVLATDPGTLPLWHWRVVFGLLAAYCGGGALLGVLAVAFSGESPVRARAAFLSVVMFVVNGLLVPAAWFEDEFLVIAVMWAVLLLTRWRAEFASPWLASLCLLGPFWLHQEFLTTYPRITRAAVLAALGLICAGAWLALRRRVDLARAFSPRRDAIAAAILIPALCATTWLLRNDAPPRLPTRAASPSSGSNVILLVMDAARADHLSVYGYHRDTTPNLKRFAGEATLYRRAIASGDMSLPSHASMFTGQYPSRHGAHNTLPDHPVGRPLSADAITLAERLRGAGYRTAAVTANFAYVNRAFGLHQGFEVWDDRRLAITAHSWEKHYLRGGVRAILRAFRPVEYLLISHRGAGQINSSVFALLEDLRARTPFFLFVNYMDTHDPYHPPEPFLSRFGAQMDPDWRNGFDGPDMIVPSRRRMSARLREQLVARFDASIAYLDFEIARLFDRLKHLGLYDNSVIIVTSDHGETFGEKDLYGHGLSVIQSLVHVPLIIRYPGGRHTGAIDDLAGHADIFPTVLPLAGLAAGNADGVNLLDPMARRDRFIVAESHPFQALYDFSPRFRRVERAVFQSDRKLLLGANGVREMYDPWRDPHESRNLYDPADPVARQMERALSDWLARNARPRTRSAPLDRKTIERLRALGYIQ
ncbi:MAG: sulfatase [Bryobacteraceae bacterium]